MWPFWKPPALYDHPAMGGSGAVAQPGAPSLDDTRDAAARYSRGLSTQFGVVSSTQQLLAHNSYEPRIIRVQLAPGAPLPNEALIDVIVEHGVDGGPTIARAVLPTWGVALQVPAGQIKVSLRIRERSEGVPIPTGAIAQVFTSCTCGLLRERDYIDSFDVSQPLPTPNAFPFLVEPPPFAVRVIASAFAGGGVKYTNLAGTWSQVLDSNLATPPQGYIEVKQAAQPLLLQGWTSGNGVVEFRWKVFE